MTDPEKRAARPGLGSGAGKHPLGYVDSGPVRCVMCGVARPRFEGMVIDYVHGRAEVGAVCSPCMRQQMGGEA